MKYKSLLSTLAVSIAIAVAGCTNTTASSGSTTGQGGSGGMGGAGGSGGTGGSGPCLGPSAYQDLFSSIHPTLCVVAKYTADNIDLGYTASPTWGKHGGPLLVFPDPAGGIILHRLTPPAEAMGALTSSSQPLDPGIPAGAFVGSQAIDLPFFDWTAISWTGAAFPFQGEVILLEAATVANRYDVNGYFAGIGLGAQSAGRFLYSGLSQLNDVAGSTNSLYAADTCGAVGQNPRLLPQGDPTCTPPATIDTWGDFSGPVVQDKEGNVFAAFASFTDQEARGFAAETIVPGAPPTLGSTLFILPGGGSNLAVLTPTPETSGLLAFQPTDASTFAPLDPIAVGYHIAGTMVEAEGNPTPLLTLVTPGLSLPMMSDPTDRLWVAVPNGSGGTIFVVLARQGG